MPTPIARRTCYCEENLRDPLPFQRQLREAGPVVRLSKYGVYATARYEHVRAGLSQYDDLISSAGVGLADLRQSTSFRDKSLLIEADPPAHTPRREVISKILSPRALRAFGESFSAAATRVVDELLQRDELEGVTDLVQAYLLEVFIDAVGLDPDIKPLLLPWGDLIFNAGGPENDLYGEAMRKIAPHIQTLMAQTERRSLCEGGLGAAVFQAADDGLLPHEEAPRLMRSILAAGVDTTVAGLSATLHSLATAPGQWQVLRNDPRLVPMAFEEAIRLDSPVQTFYRTAVRRTDLAGTDIPADAKLYLSVGGANRDPRQFESPDSYDITRRVAGHVGFGWGIHQCVGQHLGRAEAASLLSVLVEKVEAIDLVGVPERRLNNTMRSWGSLPLRLAPAR